MASRMTDESASHGDQSPTELSPSRSTPTIPSSLPLRIPKNKSTGNLLGVLTASPVTTEGRTRFSFDAGASGEVNNLKRTIRSEHDGGLGVSGLRRIRRPGPSSRQSTLVFDEPEVVLPTLQNAVVAPASGRSSRSVSRSASTHMLTSTPASPVLEDLHRFPSESLHSFSFAKRTEDFLHSRQNILQKSVEFMRERSGWAANPGLANAQARISGDAEIQGMMDLLRRAKVVPALDINAAQSTGVGLGPLTGPADFEGPNVFERSFNQGLDTVVSSHRNSFDERHELRKGSLITEDGRTNDELPRSVETPQPNLQPPSRKPGLKRTYTDVNSVSLQQRLIEALAQPYSSEEPPYAQGKNVASFGPAGTLSSAGSASAVHGGSTKWAPPAQAVFRTSAEAPWTIVSANDLACLAFGVTRAEVRNLSILGIIQEDRRQWLEEKLQQPEPVAEKPKTAAAAEAVTGGSSLLLGSRGGGVTARLLSKAPSRVTKSKADNGSGVSTRATPSAATSPSIPHHPPTKSRGVLLCGDIVPIRKRNGTPGAASFWVMEKRGGLIWVIEEITEDVAWLKFDADLNLTGSKGDVEQIWGQSINNGSPLSSLLPRFPPKTVDEPGYEVRPVIRYYTASTMGAVSVPVSITNGSAPRELRVSSLPHIAGVMVIDPRTLKITSSNSVFSGALFGYDKPAGLEIDVLIPGFGKIVEVLTEEDDHDLVDGLVVPEHSFRRARAALALREGKDAAADSFKRPSGLIARHKDGSDIMIDVQMRVVRSETVFPVPEDVILEEQEDALMETSIAVSELVYAIWVTYSRQLHSAGFGVERSEQALQSRPVTPPTQPLPVLPSPPPTVVRSPPLDPIPMSLSQVIGEASPAEPLEHPPPGFPFIVHEEKKKISDFTILEEMGKGAYGEVKLGRYKSAKRSKVVLKYVVKRRILVDTWTRDRRLGTVPLEIHVLDFLRTPGMQHPNIVEMIDFFEDANNYYIEMQPHGLPGMDLFDYIELRANMEEVECRNIFRQVVDAVHHLHVKAQVVHRDIKDENVVLDGEGNIKLIDFGSATYIRNGPFDVFVGTLDYAAPEVLQGKPYGGTEQDVWALGILLYTLAYRENPFYNIDEILDHPLRIPYIPFSESCIDLIRRMLDRDVEQRINITEVMKHEWLEETED